MVMVLQILFLSYFGELWKDLRDLGKICEVLNVINRVEVNEIIVKESDMKYFIVFFEIYSNVISGNVRK